MKNFFILCLVFATFMGAILTMDDMLGADAPTITPKPEITIGNAYPGIDTAGLHAAIQKYNKTWRPPTKHLWGFIK